MELALRYGMRDCLTCPVGGRWIVVYWSPQVLSRLTQEQRALLFLGASFAAIELQKIIEPVPNRLGRGSCLTPRELAVLRLLAEGKRVAEVEEDRSEAPKCGGRTSGSSTNAKLPGLCRREEQE